MASSLCVAMPKNESQEQTSLDVFFFIIFSIIGELGAL
jgi:hypothetical protein